jgi:hypothetical protein
MNGRRLSSLKFVNDSRKNQTYSLAINNSTSSIGYIMKGNKVGVSNELPIKSQECPFCKWEIESTAGIGLDASGKDAVPTKGCRAVCSNCFNWLIFEDNLVVREMEESDILAMTDEQFHDIIEIGHFLRRVKRDKEERLFKATLPLEQLFGGLIRG